MLPMATARSSRLVRFLALATAMTLILYVTFWKTTRNYDLEGLALICALMAATVVLKPNFKVLRPMLPLLACTALYMVISGFHVFPKAWTVYWQPSAILRQGAFIFILPLSVMYFYVLFSEWDPLKISRIQMAAMLIFIVGARMLGAVFDPALIGIYTFGSVNVIIVFALMAFICRFRGAALKAVLIIACVPLMTSAQSMALMPIAAAAVFTRAYKLVMMGFLVPFVALLVVAPHYPALLYRLDSNTGVRAQFWHDALIAFWESNGIGLGFGTESIRNDFSVMNRGFRLDMQYSDSILNVGTHSVFYDHLIKMGILGLAATIYLFVALTPTKTQSVAQNDFNFIVYLILLIATGINVGFGSIAFLLGAVVCIGWLTYQKSLLAEATASPTGRIGRRVSLAVVR